MEELREIYTLRTLPSWALALTGVLGTVVGFAIFILGAGLLLFLVPLVIMAGLIIRSRLRHLARQAYEQSRADGPPVIDGEFKVMNERRGKLRIFR